MTEIQIERLNAPTIVYRIGGDFGPFGGCAEVQDIQFDGEGYIITARMLEGDDDHVSDDEFEFVVDAGMSVTFGGRGEPKLRAESDVSFDEWQSAARAIGLKHDRSLVSGHVCQTIDEAPLLGAVADAIGVPAMLAAE